MALESDSLRILKNYAEEPIYTLMCKYDVCMMRTKNLTDSLTEHELPVLKYKSFQRFRYQRCSPKMLFRAFKEGDMQINFTMHKNYLFQY